MSQVRRGVHGMEAIGVAHEKRVGRHHRYRQAGRRVTRKDRRLQVMVHGLLELAGRARPGATARGKETRHV